MVNADLILIEGQIHTMDRDGLVHQAIAIGGGQVLATGVNADILKFQGPATRILELNGRAVLPGINESHAHACAYGASLPPLELDVSFPNVKSLADIRTLVEKDCQLKGEGALVIGNGWDLGYIADFAGTSRMPTRWDLDEVSPNNPVFLQDFSRHLAWVNTRWLELAGVSEDSETPIGGVIFRDSERGLTGLFAEGAQELVLKALPPMDENRRVAAIKSAVSDFNRLGITSFTEPGLGSGGFTLMGGAMSTDVLKTYIKLAETDSISARVSVLWLPCDMSGSAAETARSLAEMVMPNGIDPKRLRVIGAKIFADGIPPNKTAWMKEEYLSGGHGSLCVSGSSDQERSVELAEMIRLVHAAGLQAGVHVTGDAGIEAVVEAFESAVRSDDRTDSRHYIIHGDFASKNSLKRLGAGGFGMNMNPGIKSAISDLMDEMLGDNRSSSQWPVKSAIDAGVHVMSSSDAPVTKPDWRIAVSAMLTRKSKASGKVSGSSEIVDLHSALRAYTVEPAWQDFAEQWKGSLESGKVADVCVMGSSLLDAGADEIPEIPVDMTIFNGQVVHDRVG
jgi:predicted amidohydrolase YtcJ